MGNPTRLTDLEVLGDLTVKGNTIQEGIDATDFTVTTANATDASTAAALANALKSSFNKLVTKLCTGEDPS